MSIDILIDSLNTSIVGTDAMADQITDKITGITMTRSNAPALTELDRLSNVLDGLLNAVLVSTMYDMRAHADFISSSVDIDSIPVINSDSVASGLIGSSRIIGIDTRNGPVNLSVAISDLISTNVSGGEFCTFVDIYNSWDVNPATIYFGDIVNDDGIMKDVYGDIDDGTKARISSDSRGGVIAAGVVTVAELVPVCAIKYNKQTKADLTPPSLLTASDVRNLTGCSTAAEFNMIRHADGCIQYFGTGEIDGERIVWPHAMGDNSKLGNREYRLMGMTVSGTGALDTGQHKFKPVSIIPINDDVVPPFYELLDTTSRYYSHLGNYVIIKMYGVKYNAVPGLESSALGPGVYCAVAFTYTLVAHDGTELWRTPLSPTLDPYTYAFSHINLDTPSQTAGFRIDIRHFELGDAIQYSPEEHAPAERAVVSCFIQPTFVEVGGYSYSNHNRLYSISTAVVVTSESKSLNGESHDPTPWALARGATELTPVLTVEPGMSKLLVSIDSHSVHSEDGYSYVVPTLLVSHVKNGEPGVDVYKCNGIDTNLLLASPRLTTQPTLWPSGTDIDISITHTSLLSSTYGVNVIHSVMGTLTNVNAEPQVITVADYAPGLLDTAIRGTDYSSQLIDDVSNAPGMAALRAASGEFNYVSSPKIGTGWKNNTIFVGWGTNFLESLDADILDMVVVNNNDGGQIFVLVDNGSTKSLYVYKLTSEFTQDPISMAVAIDTEIDQTAYGFSRPTVSTKDHRGIVTLLATNSEVILATNNGLDRVGYSAWFAPTDRVRRTFK